MDNPSAELNTYDCASSLYKSLPIRGEDVRVIKLKPGRGSDPISCDLFVRSLKSLKSTSEPQSHLLLYKALSYVWGEPIFSNPMLCNGHQFSVTSNLCSALQHLRNDVSPVILWVDQICINQTDVDERNRQLRNVGEIFKLAQSVIVWLGVKAQNSDLAMKALEHGRLKEPRHITVAAVNSLLRRPWF